jgi:hypothetical protein
MKFKHLKNKEIKTNIFKRLGLSADASSVGSSWAFKYIWQGWGAQKRGSRVESLECPRIRTPTTLPLKFQQERKTKKKKQTYLNARGCRLMLHR